LRGRDDEGVDVLGDDHSDERQGDQQDLEHGSIIAERRVSTYYRQRRQRRRKLGEVGNPRKVHQKKAGADWAGVLDGVPEVIGTVPSSRSEPAINESLCDNEFYYEKKIVDFVAMIWLRDAGQRCRRAPNPAK